jgi:hypothetical protein
MITIATAEGTRDPRRGQDEAKACLGVASTDDERHPQNPRDRVGKDEEAREWSGAGSDSRGGMSPTRSGQLLLLDDYALHLLSLLCGAILAGWSTAGKPGNLFVRGPVFSRLLAPTPARYERK